VANEVFLSVDLNNRSVPPDPYVPDPLPGTAGGLPAPDPNGGRHG
jgi:citrate synthase